MKKPFSAEQVIDEHLELARSGDEGEFLRSYREDSFLIMIDGVHRGLKRIRACYRQLKEQLPNARYNYKVLVVEEDVAFLEWSADSDTHTMADGADSYVVRDDYIRVQTIH